MTPDDLTIDTPRGRFASRAAGSRRHPLVLCLHGFPDDASTFDDLLDWLVGHGFRAVAPYSRGYAPSPVVAPANEFDRIDTCARDVAAIADALSPNDPVWIVGHGVGALIVYRALQLFPDRFTRAVTLATGHPAALARNARWSPWGWWRTRHTLLFQMPRVSEWYVRRADFAYVDELWRRWSPGRELPAKHLVAVKQTLAASWPEPLWHDRAGGIEHDSRPIRTPTLHLVGDSDRRLGPAAAAGQERYFTGPFQSEVVPGAGHFLHLEQPTVVARQVVDWLVTPCGPAPAPVILPAPNRLYPGRVSA